MPSVRCTLEIGDDDKRLLRLIYTMDGKWDLQHRVEQVIPLQSTHPHFGGLRWWFTCLSIADGERCGRRVGKLYRPPDQRHFACRHCLDLTYESCQKSHRYDGLFALMAGEACGETFEAVKEVFSYHTKEARSRRAASSPRLLEAFEKTFGETQSH